jgi:hypothetical protein
MVFDLLGPFRRQILYRLDAHDLPLGGGKTSPISAVDVAFFAQSIGSGRFLVILVALMANYAGFTRRWPLTS